MESAPVTNSDGPLSGPGGHPALEVGNGGGDFAQADAPVWVGAEAEVLQQEGADSGRGTAAARAALACSRVSVGLSGMALRASAYFSRCPRRSNGGDVGNQHAADGFRVLQVVLPPIEWPMMAACWMPWAWR